MTSSKSFGQHKPVKLAGTEKKSWREQHTSNSIAGSLPPGMPRAQYQGMWTTNPGV
jgi:hypothetical protein